MGVLKIFKWLTTYICHNNPIILHISRKPYIAKQSVKMNRNKYRNFYHIQLKHRISFTDWHTLYRQTNCDDVRNLPKEVKLFIANIASFLTRVIFLKRYLHTPKGFHLLTFQRKVELIISLSMFWTQFSIIWCLVTRMTIKDIISVQYQLGVDIKYRHLYTSLGYFCKYHTYR